jgi:RES domain-containing protein
MEAEFAAIVSRGSLPVSTFLPRAVCVISASLKYLLDLRSPTGLRSVGLKTTDVTGRDWSGCQAVGVIAHRLDFEGLLAPSSTGRGEVLAVFEDQILPGSSVREASREIWAPASG